MMLSIILYAMTVLSKVPPSIWNEMAKNYKMNHALKADYAVAYFQQIVDHNQFADTKKFKQKYLVKTKYWKEGNPVFFYCGNEGPVEMFYENSYFLNNVLAEEFGAMVVYLEHRYFGTSMPFGTQEESYKKENLIHLTSAQGLQDFVVFLKWFKQNVAPKSKVVAFGGSYGGMLASWLRMKFPNIVDGALALSAPIYYFKNREGLDIDIFYRIATNSFRRSSIGDKCVDVLRETFRRLEKSTNYQAINKGFKTCTPVTNSTGVRFAEDWLNNGLTYMSMTDYPYETKFLKRLPGNPTIKACEQLIGITTQSSDEQLFDGARRAAEIYYNYEQKETCNEVYGDNTTDDDLSGWNILACGDMVMPMGSNGITDMYNDRPFNYLEYTKYCQDIYGLTPNYEYTLDYYGGVNDQEMTAYSYIFYSNGQLDPWSGGSPIKDISYTMQTVYMKDCSHHLDLREPNPLDPESVIQGRNKERNFIKRILTEKQYTSL